MVLNFLLHIFDEAVFVQSYLVLYINYYTLHKYEEELQVFF